VDADTAAVKPKVSVTPFDAREAEAIAGRTGACTVELLVTGLSCEKKSMGNVPEVFL
jgi:hypothetical protein